MPVKTFYMILEYVTAAAFGMLGWITYRQWAHRKDPSAMWAFVTFASLGLVAVLGIFLPEESDWPGFVWVTKLLVAVILLFPYFLYRVSSSFRREKTWMDSAAAIATLAVVIWNFTLPEFPAEGEPRSPQFEIFILAVLALWVILSLVVAVRFWKAGAGQPAVSRKRMRMLSLASMALSIVIVVSGETNAGDGSLLSVASQLVTLLSVSAFWVAFAPPRWLRQSWRRPVEESLRRGTLELMKSENAEQVMDVLLPHAIGIVGGEGIAALDQRGRVIGANGMDPAGIARAGNVAASAIPGHRDVVTGLVHLEFPFGALVVQTGPYTPFFGQDEIDLLGLLGALANLALERVAAGDMRMQLEKAALRRQQALEINDNIVQGLAVAKYSFDLDQIDRARDAVEGTLIAARSIISELIEGEDAGFGGGSLTRDRAASGFTASELTRERHAEEAGEREPHASK